MDLRSVRKALVTERVVAGQESWKPPGGAVGFVKAWLGLAWLVVIMDALPAPSLIFLDSYLLFGKNSLLANVSKSLVEPSSTICIWLPRAVTGRYTTVPPVPARRICGARQ
jgi:hypothetical protein